MFSVSPVCTTFRCKLSSCTLKNRANMVLLKFEGVKPSVLPSNSSETTSTIFSCSGTHIHAFFGHVLLPRLFLSRRLKSNMELETGGDIITEYRMQTKEYERRNDRGKNRTRNRGNIMPEFSIQNKEWRNARVWQEIGGTTEAAYLTDNIASRQYGTDLMKVSTISRESYYWRNLIPEIEKKTGNL